MFIPEGMQKEHVVETIRSVARKLSKKYRFGFYNEEDIEQEAFLLIVEKEILQKYDFSKPLENFLAVVLKNRLYNFKRDNYFRPTPPCINCPLKAFISPDRCSAYEDMMDCSFYKKWQNVITKRKNIMYTVNIENISDVDEPSMSYSVNFLENIDEEEFSEKILQYLNIKSRKYYLMMKNGVKIKNIELNYLLDEIKRVLLNNGKHE